MQRGYRGEDVVFSRVCRVSTGLAGTALPIAVEVTFQACDPQKCLIEQCVQSFINFGYQGQVCQNHR